MHTGKPQSQCPAYVDEAARGIPNILLVKSANNSPTTNMLIGVRRRLVLQNIKRDVPLASIPIKATTYRYPPSNLNNHLDIPVVLVPFNVVLNISPNVDASYCSILIISICKIRKHSHV
jgi:hypothetical protein